MQKIYLFDYLFKVFILYAVSSLPFNRDLIDFPSFILLIILEIVAYGVVVMILKIIMIIKI